MKSSFYTLDKILTYNADYNIIYGERSNGKTTAVLAYALKEHIKSNYKHQLGLIRRWEEDFKGTKSFDMVKGIISLGWVSKWTKERYNTIIYRSMNWYLANIHEDGTKEEAEQPFIKGFAISSQEHVKSTAYPDIKTILFDEFITRDYYLPDEFIKFQNLLSTIIRLRDDVVIFMCGNTVNKYCPYFKEMGLNSITKQKQDTIDIYTYGESTLKVAVEYSIIGDKKIKKSNKYFAFNNPKLQMITNGTWEIDIYPHLPIKYTPKEVKYTYFIIWEDATLQCEIIHSKELSGYFTYIHLKTTPIKEDNKNIVYQVEPSAKPNYRRNITITDDKITNLIYNFYKNDKVFYQSNDIGELIRNYMMWCRTSTL